MPGHVLGAFGRNHDYHGPGPTQATAPGGLPGRANLDIGVGFCFHAQNMNVPFVVSLPRRDVALDDIDAIVA